MVSRNVWARMGRLLLVPAIALGLCQVGRVQAQPAEGSGGDVTSLGGLRRLEAEMVELQQAGRFSEAIPLAQFSLAVREKALGPNHIATANSLSNLGLLYESIGDFAKAEPLYRRALDINEALFGSKHARTAPSVYSLALVYESMGDNAQAAPLYKKALDISEATFGLTHRDTASALNNLARAYQSMGDYAHAEPLFKRAVDIFEAALGSKHPNIATSLNNLGTVYQAMGRYAEAEKLYKRALKLREAALGPEHPATANSLNNLASIYGKMGDYPQAEKLYKKALKIREATIGPEHQDTATSLNNLALLYRSMGDYAQAEPLFKRALDIRQAALGPTHADTAASLNNLAFLYGDMGDYAKAERLYKRALKIFEAKRGSTHPDTAASLNNLAGLYSKTGDYAKAAPLLMRALKINEASLGPNHPRTANSLNSLAFLYSTMGAYTEAEPLYKRAVKIREATIGHNHPDTATSLNNLANLYQNMDQLPKAELLLKRALKIFEATLGPNHQATTNSLNNVAVLYLNMDQLPKAIALSERAEAGEEDFLAATLISLSEARRQTLLGTFKGSTYSLYSLHARSAPNNPRARNLALRALLRRKGRVLEGGIQAMAALRANLGEDTLEIFDNLSHQQARLATLVLAGPGKNDNYLEEMAGLYKDVEALEAELASKSVAFAQQRATVTIASVQTAIPPGAALVEFAWYKPFLAKNKPDERWGEPRYSAYILRTTGEPSFVDLGEAAPIDAAVRKARASLADDRVNPNDAGRDLYDQVIAPLLPHIEGANALLFSPDGQLNLAPLHAAIDKDDHYLLESYAVSYLTSGRDLLRYAKPIDSQSEPLIVANPAFDGVVDKAAREEGLLAGTRHTRSIDFNDLRFSPLPGSAREGEKLATLLPTAKLLTASDASEETLKSVRGPRILHLATHGAFLPDRKRIKQSDGSEVSVGENPLLRSLLALAGANPPHDAGEDGVLTAYEASGLNLYGTKLVVLSACETAAGDVKNGEGVYGLRRAFVLAGAETQVMSLWKVDDEVTQMLMVSFYKKLLAGQGRAEALRQAQLELLGGKYAHPYYWAAFSAIGNTATLDGQPATIHTPKLQQRRRGCGGCSTTGQGGSSLLIAFLALWRRRTSVASPGRRNSASG